MKNLDTLIRDFCNQICNSEELCEEWKSRGFVLPDVLMSNTETKDEYFFNTVVNALLHHEARYGVKFYDYFIVGGDNRGWFERHRC
jgi:hypothetical protein